MATPDDLLKALAAAAGKDLGHGVETVDAMTRAGIDFPVPGEFWDAPESLARKGEVVIIEKFLGPSAHVRVTRKGMSRAATL